MEGDWTKAALALEVVKVITTEPQGSEPQETVLEGDFVAVCSALRPRLKYAGPGDEVTLELPDLYPEAIQKAMEYWKQARAGTLDTAAFLRTVTDTDLMRLINAAGSLGYDPLFEVLRKEYFRRVDSLGPDPNFKVWGKTPRMPPPEPAPRYD